MHEARKGLRRANMISKNSRVGAQKREEKKEIALWFEVWLIAPEAFELWLRMRKARLQTGDSGPVV